MTLDSIKERLGLAPKKPQSEADKPMFNDNGLTAEDFQPDIKQGIYVGAGIKISGTEDERRTVVPMFINWGDLAGHMAVYGTTRVGKTRFMVSLIRQCILRGMNVLVVEPKGAIGNKKDIEAEEDLGIGQETLGWVMQFAEEAGRLNDIKYVSPKFPDLSIKFNPLFGMTNEEVANLITTIIPSDDEFFIALGYQITLAILLGLDFLERVLGKDHINRIIRDEYVKYYNNNIEEYDDSIILNPDLASRAVMGNKTSVLSTNNIPSRTLVTFADIVLLANQDGIKNLLKNVESVTSIQFSPTLSQMELDELKNLRSQAQASLRDMANKDANFFSKVSTSYMLVISQLATGQLGKLTCSVKINPLIDGFTNKSRGQILLVQPFPLIFKTASNIFVRIFFATLTFLYGNIGASGRGLPRETALFVDEGGAVLYNGVQDLFNKAGGLGLRIFIFTQSFADYESELGKEIAKIVNDNTNIKVYMRMNDNTSRELVSNAFGKIKVENNKYMGSKLDIRVTANMEDREILLPAHMGDMQKQEFLLQFGEGRFYCCAPFQPDPDYLFKVPKVEMEEIFGVLSQEFKPVLDIEAPVNEIKF